MPIDHFLRSLAQDCRSGAIGVILSGAGSDGSLGLQAIKEAGGITFAQEPATAEYPNMPQMAEAATSVDFVLGPAQIAAELARISRHPHFSVEQPAEPEITVTDGSSGPQRHSRGDAPEDRNRLFALPGNDGSTPDHAPPCVAEHREPRRVCHRAQE